MDDQTPAEEKTQALELTTEGQKAVVSDKTSLTRHAGGRPTKYSPDVFEKIEEYLEGCSRENTKLPTVEGLANKLNVTSETIREWADKYPEFSLTIKKLKDRQKEQLMDDGMYGGKEVNASMAIFLLKAIHGLKDGSGVYQQFNTGGDMTLEFIK